jgi:RHS repeat-associated protein
MSFLRFLAASNAVRVLAAAAAIVLACSPGDNASDHQPNEPVAVQRAALVTCDHSAPFGPVEPAFTGVTTANGITFSQDGRTAYVSAKTGTSTNYDVYVATRTSTEVEFGASLTAVTSLSSSVDDRVGSLSPDGSKFFLAKAGTSGKYDLAAATFNTTTGAFDAPQLLSALNTSLHEQDPFFLPINGGQLYFSAETPPNDIRELYVSPASNGFSTKQMLFSHPAEDFRPVLTTDAQRLYFASSRATIARDAEGDVWTWNPATTSIDPIDLYVFSSPKADYPVALADGGCTLYIASNRYTRNEADYQLFKATRGSSTPANVTTTVRILGTGSTTTAPFQCSTNCSAQGAPGSQLHIFGTSQALWGGACIPDGNNPSSDGFVIFSQGGVCTVDFRGVCGSGRNIPRDDDNPCTTDTCDPAQGVFHDPLPGTACTTSAGTPGICSAFGVCVNAGAGAVCEVNADCATGLVCSDGACAHPCTNNTDCPGGAECFNGTCGPLGGAGGSGGASGTGGVGGSGGASGSGGVGGSSGTGGSGGTAGSGECSGDCGPGETGCVENADCEAGLFCLDGTCIEPECLRVPTAVGCGRPGDPCGEKCTAQPICEDDSDCPTGQVCPEGNGWRYGVPGLRVCVDPAWDCPSRPKDHGCGGPLSPCGVCETSTNCQDKQCGDADLDDGSGFRCTGICGPGESGCERDSDCVGGHICRGNACRPSDPCSDPFVAPPVCGDANSLCGPCNPVAPTNSPPRQCGSDPYTNQNLGNCPNGTYCNADGQCTAVGVSPPVVVPVPGGGDRTVTPPEAPIGVGIGAINGSFAVTDRGSAMYSIPIELPPGRAVQPSLALRYTSSTGNGSLGVGWSLDGLSTITRCPRTYAQDGRTEPVRGTAEDALCLDGQRLTPMANGDYRTAVDTFSRVRPGFIAGQDLQPDSFTVHTKDGRILTYGGTEDARAMMGTAVVGTWALSRIADRSGNFVRIKYRNELIWPSGAADFSTAELLPDIITYTGHGTVDGDREIVFDHRGDRADQLSGWRIGGGSFSRRQRLASISVRVAGKQVRRYFFSHDYVRNSMRLTSIRECVGPTPTEPTSALCKPPTTFDYIEEFGFESAFGEPAPIINASIPGNPIPSLSAFGIPFKWGATKQMDFLATATIDSYVIRSSPFFAAAAMVAAFVPTVGPYASAVLNVIGSHADSQYTKYTPHNVEVLSLSDGGGVVSSLEQPCGRNLNPSQHLLVRNHVVGYSQEIRHVCPSVRTTGRLVPLGLLPPAPGFPPILVSQEALYTPQLWYVDADGDGVQDKLFCSQDGTKLNIKFTDAALAQGADIPEGAHDGNEDVSIPAFGNICKVTCPGVDWPICIADQTFSSVFDVNGDGTSDLVVFDREQGWAALEITGHSGGWRTDWFDGVSLRPNQHYYTVTIDANGDGLRDLLGLPTADAYANGAGQRPMVVWNTGAGFRQEMLVADIRMLAEAPSYPLFVVDLNHDGVEELMEPQSEWGGGWLNRRVSLGKIVGDHASGSTLAAGPGTLGDFDGDGDLDAFTLTRTFGNEREFNLHRGVGRHDGLLKKVTDGLGRAIEIDYDTPHDEPFVKEVPASHQNCKWPIRCPTRPDHRLVTAHRELHYLDQARTQANLDHQYSYAYGQWYGDMAGYGLLGVNARRIIQKDGVGIEQKRTVVEYHDPQRSSENVPYVHTLTGLVTKTIETYALTSSPISTVHSPRTDTTLSWDVATSDAGLPFAYVREKIVANGIAVVENVEENPANPPIWKALLEEFSRELMVSGVDAYGNVTDVSVTGTSIAPKTIHRDFTPTAAELEAWLIGLQKTEHATSSAPWCHNEANCAAETRSRYSEIHYDANGLVHIVRRQPGDPNLERTTELGRDEFGNVTQVTVSDAQGNVRESGAIFDSRGLFPETFLRTGDGRTETTQVRYDDRFGTPTVSVDPNGIDRTWSYDEFGVQRTSHGPEGDHAFNYESADLSGFSLGGYQLALPSAYRVTSSKTGGQRIISDYNSFGQIVRRSVSGLLGAEVFEEFFYDYRNRLSSSWRPHLANVDTQGYVGYLYDELDRVILSTGADGKSVEIQHALGGTALPGYGQMNESPGPWVRVVDQNGNATASQSSYDGRVTWAVDARANRTRYRYGAFDELRYISQSELERQTIVRDDYGRVVSLLDLQRGWMPELNVYNGLDELIQTEDSAGSVRELFYDDFGRLRRTEDSDGITEWRYGTSAATNSIGRLIEAISPTGQYTRYGYELPQGDRNRGLPSRVTDEISSPSGTRIFETDFHYDQFSRLEQIDYPSVNGSRFSTKSGFDGFGNAIKVSNPNNPSDVYWEVAEADQGYRIKTERLGRASCAGVLGVATQRGYEPTTGRAQSIQTTCGESVLQHLTYAYDFAGNLSRRTNVVAGVTETFGHDSVDRIEKVNDVVAFTYETNSEGLASQLGIGSYEPQLGGPSTVANMMWTARAGPNTYKHDEIGNTIRRTGPTVPGGSQTIDYTAFDLPRQVTFNEGSLVDFAYNADGSRVLKTSTITGTTTYYAGELYQRIESPFGAPPKNRNMIYAGGRLVAIATSDDTPASVASPTFQYLHDDRLGSIQTVSTASGAVQYVRDYSAFGVQRAASPGFSDVPFGFTGHEEDPDLGLINMRGRMYDPYLGQFLTADPIVQQPFGHGLNRFAYVNNSPLKYVDPTGYSWEEHASDPGTGVIAWGAGVTGGAACMGYCGSALSGLGGALTGAWQGVSGLASGLHTAASSPAGSIGSAGVSLLNLTQWSSTPPVQQTPVAQTKTPTVSDSGVPPAGRTSSSSWAPVQEGYRTPWEAARGALERYNPDSILSKNPADPLSYGDEYGGLIYERGGRYHFTEAVVGEEQGHVDPWQTLDKIPADARNRVVGDYHTHGGPNAIVDGEDFSGLRYGPGSSSDSLRAGSDIVEARTDLVTRRANILDPKRYTSYLGTPSGRFGVYNPHHGTVFSFSPSSRLLPPNTQTPASAYAWH